MKGPSEGQVGDALRRLGWDALKLPDDGRGWKPCDFIAFASVLTARAYPVCSVVWIEVKMERGPTFDVRDIRPSQRVGIARAQRLGIPYWLVIHWIRTTGPMWTALELTNIDRAQVWTQRLSLSDTAWDARSKGSSPSDLLMEVIGAGSAEPHGQPDPQVRGRSGSSDLQSDAGRSVRSLRQRQEVPR